MIINSWICMLTGFLMLAAMSCFCNHISKIKYFKEGFETALMAIGEIFLLEIILFSVVDRSIDDAFMAQGGIAKLFASLFYMIQCIIAMFGLSKGIKLVCFIHGLWVPEDEKENVIHIVWYENNHSVYRLLWVDNTKIREYLKENIEIPIKEIQKMALNKDMHYHYELQQTYQSFAPRLKALYNDIEEWEKMYENAEADDWKKEKQTYLKDLFLQKSDTLEHAVAAMKDEVNYIMEKEKKYRRDERNAFKNTAEQEVFKNLISEDKTHVFHKG